MASAIRNEILPGGVQHEEQVKIAPLAEKLKMSITPVREALLLLAQDGWVVHEPNRGFRMAPIRHAASIRRSSIPHFIEFPGGNRSSGSGTRRSSIASNGATPTVHGR